VSNVIALPRTRVVEEEIPSTLVDIYRAHHAHVRAFAQRLLGDADAAEDLVHDVFVTLPRALARFRGECAMRTFVIAVAAKHAQQHIRAVSRRRAAERRMALEPRATST
jgi:RNA polymerase sigma-70 factor (ECF subfamily)